MIPDYLVDHLQRYSSEYFIYPWNLFELRLQEEMIRSDRSGSPFFFAEFLFSNLPDVWPAQSDARRFWGVLLGVLASGARGSDVKGLLEGDKGIGLVMLDSGAEGWQEFYRRLQIKISKDAPDLLPALELWESKVIRLIYPECVRSESEEEA